MLYSVFRATAAKILIQYIAELLNHLGLGLQTEEQFSSAYVVTAAAFLLSPKHKSRGHRLSHFLSDWISRIRLVWTLGGLVFVKCLAKIALWSL